MYDFKQIAQLLPFLREAFGPDAEILLCDTEHILYAENPISDRAKPGNRLGDMERSFIEEEIYKTRDSVSNYRALLPSRERLRASTLFLRNEDGSLAGFLTINIRVESMLQARDIIDTLINGSSPYSAGYIQKGHPEPPPELISRYEGVTIVVSDIIHTVVEEFLGDFGVSADRLTATERQQIVPAVILPADLVHMIRKGFSKWIATLYSPSSGMPAIPPYPCPPFRRARTTMFLT